MWILLFVGEGVQEWIIGRVDVSLICKMEIIIKTILIHSADIYSVLIQCQALFQMLEDASSEQNGQKLLHMEFKGAL